MIIDFHTHVGDFRKPRSLCGADTAGAGTGEASGLTDQLPVTWEGLIQRMDEEGIDRAVCLPLGVTPESMQGPFRFAPRSDLMSQIEAAMEHRDRAIPFGNIDPRMGCLGNLEPDQVDNRPGSDFSWTLEKYAEMGCVGIGEVTANIAMDDPRMVTLCRQCAKYDLPVLMHCTGPGSAVYGLYDDVGSPRLERLLQQAPDTIIIGHSPGFWAEISGDIQPENKFVYPEGPIAKEGSLFRLLRAYPNLYADISANSGYNAISRDRDAGLRFLTEFQDRVLYGTDVCFGGPEGRMPHLGYLRSLLADGRISEEIFDKITGGNALKVLKLYRP